jgi:16S rRNA (uracil1498-N3)-methyltransferase
MLHLFRVEQIPSQTLTLTGDAGKHAAAALRLRVGEQVKFTDGVGNVAIGTVAELISKSEISFSLSKHEFVSKPTPTISVLQALPKGDKSVEAVELMVEVGVDEIYPWQAQRSVAHWDAKKQISAVAKWQVTADAAAAQARRVWFPRVHELVTNIDSLQGKFDQIIVFHEESSPPVPAKIAHNVLIVIGPEGSITDQERAKLKELGAVEARMGESILRSRHAGIAAAAAVLSRTARWGNE